MPVGVAWRSMAMKPVIATEGRAYDHSSRTSPEYDHRR
jgi:hypothetical protein